VSLKFAPSDYEIYIPIAEWIEKHCGKVVATMSRRAWVL
jgi:hypothetical protein